MCPTPTHIRQNVNCWSRQQWLPPLSLCLCLCHSFSLWLHLLVIRINNSSLYCGSQLQKYTSFVGVETVVIGFGRWSCFDSWVWFEKASGVFWCPVLFRMAKNLCQRNNIYRCPSQWLGLFKMPGLQKNGSPAQFLGTQKCNKEKYPSSCKHGNVCMNMWLKFVSTTGFRWRV